MPPLDAADASDTIDTAQNHSSQRCFEKSIMYFNHFADEWKNSLWTSEDESSCPEDHHSRKGLEHQDS